MNITEIKNTILKEVLATNVLYFDIQTLYDLHRTEILLVKESSLQLEKEGLIKFDNLRYHITLTKNGKRAASIGYEIYENELEEEEKEAKHFAKEKARLELKALQFNHTWRFLIILSFVISLAGLVVAVLANMKPSH